MFIFDPEKVYPKKLISPAVIRFQDCDPLNHLNNIKYFDYFFNAREDAFESNYRFDFMSYFKKYKATWVAYNHQIAYLNSATIKEKIHIISSVLYYDDSTILTEYVMTDYSLKTLKAVLWSTSKYVDVQTGKKTKHQPELSMLLSKVVDSTINMEETNFEKRVKSIKSELLEGTYYTF